MKRKDIRNRLNNAHSDAQIRKVINSLGLNAQDDAEYTESEAQAICDTLVSSNNKPAKTTSQPNQNPGLVNSSTEQVFTNSADGVTDYATQLGVAKSQITDALSTTLADVLNPQSFYAEVAAKTLQKCQEFDYTSPFVVPDVEELIGSLKGPGRTLKRSEEPAGYLEGLVDNSYFNDPEGDPLAYLEGVTLTKEENHAANAAYVTHYPNPHTSELEVAPELLQLEREREQQRQDELKRNPRSNGHKPCRGEYD